MPLDRTIKKMRRSRIDSSAPMRCGCESLSPFQGWPDWQGKTTGLCGSLPYRHIKEGDPVYYVPNKRFTECLDGKQTALRIGITRVNLRCPFHSSLAPRPSPPRTLRRWQQLMPTCSRDGLGRCEVNSTSSRPLDTIKMKQFP